MLMVVSVSTSANRVHIHNHLKLAEPLWTDPGLKSGNLCIGTDLSFEKKKRKEQAGNDSSNLLPKSLQVKKVTTTK